MGWYRWPEKVEDRPWKPGTQEPMDDDCALCMGQIPAGAPFYLVGFEVGSGSLVVHAACWQRHEEKRCADRTP